MLSPWFKRFVRNLCVCVGERGSRLIHSASFYLSLFIYSIQWMFVECTACYLSIYLSTPINPFTDELDAPEYSILTCTHTRLSLSIFVYRGRW